jgi:DNA-directed RNA polymerase specialized sigma24 family protein
MNKANPVPAGDESDFDARCGDVARRLNDPATYEDAAHDWYRLMFEQVYAVARKRIGRVLQARLDPLDVVQSAFRTFFRKRTEFRDKHIDELKLILVAITCNKSFERARQHLRDRRDPRLEEPASDNQLNRGKKVPVRDDPVRIRPRPLAAPARSETSASRPGEEAPPLTIDQLPDRDTLLSLLKQSGSPEDALRLEELFLHIPVELIPVFVLMLCGCAEEEIARTLGTYRKKIVRQKRAIRDTLLAELADSGFLKRFAENIPSPDPA